MDSMLQVLLYTGTFIQDFDLINISLLNIHEFPFPCKVCSPWMKITLRKPKHAEFDSLAVNT